MWRLAVPFAPKPFLHNSSPGNRRPSCVGSSFRLGITPAKQGGRKWPAPKLSSVWVVFTSRLRLLRQRALWSADVHFVVFLFLWEIFVPEVVEVPFRYGDTPGFLFAFLSLEWIFKWSIFLYKSSNSFYSSLPSSSTSGSFAIFI